MDSAAEQPSEVAAKAAEELQRQQNAALASSSSQHPPQGAIPQTRARQDVQSPHASRMPSRQASPAESVHSHPRFKRQRRDSSSSESIREVQEDSEANIVRRFNRIQHVRSLIGLRVPHLRSPDAIWDWVDKVDEVASELRVTSSTPNATVRELVNVLKELVPENIKLAWKRKETIADSLKQKVKLEDYLRTAMRTFALHLAEVGKLLYTLPTFTTDTDPFQYMATCARRFELLSLLLDEPIRHREGEHVHNAINKLPLAFSMPLRHLLPFNYSEYTHKLVLSTLLTPALETNWQLAQLTFQRDRGMRRPKTDDKSKSEDAPKKEKQHRRAEATNPKATDQGSKSFTWTDKLALCWGCKDQDDSKRRHLRRDCPFNPLPPKDPKAKRRPQKNRQQQSEYQQQPSSSKEENVDVFLQRMTAHSQGPTTTAELPSTTDSEQPQLLTQAEKLLTYVRRLLTNRRERAQRVTVPESRSTLKGQLRLGADWTSVPAILDTGADTCCIGRELVQHYKLDRVPQPGEKEVCLRSSKGSTRLDTGYVVKLVFRLAGTHVNFHITALELRHGAELLLGVPWMRAIGLNVSDWVRNRYPDYDTQAIPQVTWPPGQLDAPDVFTTRPGPGDARPLHPQLFDDSDDEAPPQQGMHDPGANQSQSSSSSSHHSNRPQPGARHLARPPAQVGNNGQRAVQERMEVFDDELFDDNYANGQRAVPQEDLLPPQQEPLPIQPIIAPQAVLPQPRHYAPLPPQSPNQQVSSPTSPQSPASRSQHNNGSQPSASSHTHPQSSTSSRQSPPSDTPLLHSQAEESFGLEGSSLEPEQGFNEWLQERGDLPRSPLEPNSPLTSPTHRPAMAKREPRHRAARKPSVFVDTQRTRVRAASKARTIQIAQAQAKATAKAKAQTPLPRVARLNRVVAEVKEQHKVKPSASEDAIEYMVQRAVQRLPQSGMGDIPTIKPTTDEKALIQKWLLQQDADIQAMITPIIKSQSKYLDQHPPAKVPPIHLNVELPKGKHDLPNQRPSHASEAELASAYEEMRQKGIVKRIQPQQVRFASNTFLVARKGTTKRRVVVNLIRLNKHLEAFSYILPTMDATMLKLSRAYFMSQIDLRLAYFSLPITSESVPFLSVYVPGVGYYAFQRLPMGTGSAPAYFQAAMDQTCEEIQQYIKGNIWAFFDNLYITLNNDDRQQHIQDVQLALKYLDSKRFLIQARKCEFAQRTMTVFGFTIGRHTKSLGEGLIELISAIAAKPPNTRKQMVSAIGTCQYISAHVPNFATKFSYFRDLAQAAPKERLQWTASDREFWTTTVSSLTNLPPLTPIDFSLLLRVTTDYSTTSVAGTLETFVPSTDFTSTTAAASPHEDIINPTTGEHQQGHWALNMCISRICTPPERAYSPYKGEMTAIDWVLKRCRGLLLGRPFLLRTDCNALLFANQRKHQDPKIHRMCQNLADFTIYTSHLPGKENTICDFLSRSDFQVDTPIQMRSGSILWQTQLDVETAEDLLANSSKASKGYKFITVDNQDGHIQFWINLLA